MKLKFFKAKKVITRDRADSIPYLERWNIFECKAFSIKLHHILLSDHACLHDHPWDFISIILWGGYVEHRDLSTGNYTRTETIKGNYGDTYRMDSCVAVPPKIVSKIYHPGSILYRKATDKHKLEIHQPAWTLVITFKKTRQWGFWTKGGWLPFYKYSPQNTCE